MSQTRFQSRQWSAKPLDPVTHEDPAYARGWNDAQAALRNLSLRDAAAAALTDFIYEHGSDFTPELWPGMTALQAALAEAAPHEPGAPHEYRIECGICGQPGTLRVSVDPQNAEGFAPGMEPTDVEYSRNVRRAEYAFDEEMRARLVRSEHEATHGEAEQCGAECIELGLTDDSGAVCGCDGEHCGPGPGCQYVTP